MNKKRAITAFLLILFGVSVFSIRQFTFLAETQSSLATKLHEKNVSFFYDYQIAKDQTVDPNIGRPKFGVVWDWLSVDYLHSIVQVGEYESLKQLKGLKNLRSIRISDQEDESFRIREFSKLRTVICSLKQAKDIAPFLNSSRLESLVCRSDQLDFIGRQKNLIDLRLRTLCGDWSGLSRLKNLQKLEIIASGKVDIASLSTLSKLRQLSIECCEFPDFSPLANLKNLESIDLRILRFPESETHSTSTGIHSFYFRPEDRFLTVPVKISSKLKTLTIADAFVEKISRLQNASGLNSLTIRSSQDFDLTDLIKIPNLRILTLKTLGKIYQSNWNSNSRLQSKLEVLRLCGPVRDRLLDKASIFEDMYIRPLDAAQTIGKISDDPVNLDEIPNLNRLRELHLESLSLEDNFRFKTLPGIRKLMVYNCLFKKRTSEANKLIENDKAFSENFLHSIGHLTRLESLRLIDYPIHSFKFLESLKGLTELHIRYKNWYPKGDIKPQINDFSSISKLKNLESIVIDNHRCSDFRFLKSLKKMVNVQIGFPLCGHLEGLQSLQELKAVRLWNFQKIGKTAYFIEEFSVEPLLSLKNLEEFDFDRSLKANLSELSKMPSIKTLNSAIRKEFDQSDWEMIFTNEKGSLESGYLRPSEIQWDSSRFPGFFSNLKEKWNRQFDLPSLNTSPGGIF